MNDLRDWIELLRREGELAEITAEVDPHLEITEIADRTMKAGGPALLFRNVKGSPMPLLINQFGTERRMCLALGVESLEEVRERVAGVFELCAAEGRSRPMPTPGNRTAHAEGLEPKIVGSRRLPGGRDRRADLDLLRS